MSTVKMFVSATGTTDAEATADIQADGTIEAIALGVDVTNNATPADGDGGSAELSFMSSNSFGINDVRGSLCTASARFVGAAAADGLMGVASTPLCILTPIKVPVSAGERLHLHLRPVNNTVVATCYIMINDGFDSRARLRRR